MKGYMYMTRIREEYWDARADVKRLLSYDLVFLGKKPRSMFKSDPSYQEISWVR